jgi:hypothetical protein
MKGDMDAYLHESVAPEADAIAEIVRARHVAVQRSGVELRKIK